MLMTSGFADFLVVFDSQEDIDVIDGVVTDHAWMISHESLPAEQTKHTFLAQLPAVFIAILGSLNTPSSVLSTLQEAPWRGCPFPILFTHRRPPEEDLLWLSLSGELSCSCDDLNAVEALIQSGLPFIRMVRRYVATKFANLDVPQALPRFAESSTSSLPGLF